MFPKDKGECMTEQDFITQLQNKKFFNKVNHNTGLLGPLFSNYKRFLGTTDHSIHDQVQLSYYKPKNEEYWSLTL